MRRFTVIAPLVAALASAGVAQAQPAEVVVALSPEMQERAVELGERDVARQADRLARTVDRALADHPRFQGASVRLVLKDLEPNRPTFQQVSDRPGLSPIYSLSIGGASIEGEIVTADGQSHPVRYARYSNTLGEVMGYGTWQDADRAFSRFASNLAAGRLESGQRLRSPR